MQYQKSIHTSLALTMAMTLGLSACKDSSTGESSTDNAPTAAADARLTSVFIENEPSEAISVVDARQSAKPGDEVTVVGRIAGAKSPFTGGFATLVLGDDALETCDRIPDDPCKTPWDACCVEPKTIKASRLSVQVVDDQGQPIAATLKGVKGLKELDKIIVKGKVTDDSTPENLVISATGIFQSPPTPKAEG